MKGEERSETTKEVGCRQLSTSIIITLACLNVMAARQPAKALARESKFALFQNF